tara:strand:- start:1183 stop:1431 length:249 start_codon:yes stop_codon:yes gene_type:complete
MEKEKLSSLILSIIGIVIVVDAILEQFFNIGTKQDSLVVGYCVAFILLSVKFPNLLKRKPVIIPMYIMIIQMLYSLIITYAQ